MMLEFLVLLALANLGNRSVMFVFMMVLSK